MPGQTFARRAGWTRSSGSPAPKSRRAGGRVTDTFLRFLALALDTGNLPNVWQVRERGDAASGSSIRRIDAHSASWYNPAMLKLSRRDLLTLLGAAACGSVGNDDSDSDLPDSADPDTEPPPPPWCDITPGSSAEGWEPVSLAQNPQLAAVGGFAVVTIPPAGRMNLVHVESGCYVAMGTVCTHEGCAVEVRPGARFVCPCHGALYNWEGAPIAGPAPLPLPTWPAGRSGENIWIKVR